MVNFFTAATAVVAFAAAGSQAAPAAEKLTVPQQNALDQHNMYRKKHSAPPLVWDAKLAEYAQKWSDGCDFKHSGGPYGENLASGVQEYTKAVDMWYNEVKDYDYSKPGFSMKTGHFTQVVWKGTKRVGCGRTACNGHPLITCEYAPAGNVIGQFPQNVTPN